MNSAVARKEEICHAIDHTQRIIHRHEKILAELIKDPLASPVAIAEQDIIIYETMITKKYFESLPAGAPAFI